jgi:hypothetical protein
MKIFILGRESWLQFFFYLAEGCSALELEMRILYPYFTIYLSIAHPRLSWRSLSKGVAPLRRDINTWAWFCRWVRDSPRFQDFHDPSSFQDDISKRVRFFCEVIHLFILLISYARGVGSVPKIGSCQSLIIFPFLGIHERCSLKKGIEALINFQICEPSWVYGIESMNRFLAPNLYFWLWLFSTIIFFLK